jgi:uncharacterized protein involved in exopolysaccharide biosynthesis
MSIESEPELANSEIEAFSFLDFAIIVAKYKAVLLTAPVAGAIGVLLISLLLPDIYTAAARILPPQPSQSMASAVLTQLGALGGAASGALGIKSSNDLYAGMLKSRSVADAIIQRFKLRELYHADTLVQTRELLQRVTTVSVGRDGIITVEVDDEEPKRAADMANAYVEELERLTERLAVTEAGQRRLFFERQLKQAKDALALAEVELKKTQEDTGLIKLDDQGRAIIEAVAELTAQIAAKEVQIEGMRSFATERNPQLVRAQQELAGLRVQLRKMGVNKVESEGDVLVPTARVPEAGLQFIRKFRDMKYQETMFELLAKQYEIARLDEAKDAQVIQVLDYAVAPDKKSKPRHFLLAVIGAAIVGVVTFGFALVREFAARLASDPTQTQRLSMFRRYLKWRGQPE